MAVIKRAQAGVTQQLGWNHPEAHSSPCLDLGWEDLEMRIADLGGESWPLHVDGLPAAQGPQGTWMSHMVALSGRS